MITNMTTEEGVFWVINPPVKCPNCGASLAVDDSGAVCPNCGKRYRLNPVKVKATIRVQKSYSDEEEIETEHEATEGEVVGNPPEEETVEAESVENVEEHNDEEHTEEEEEPDVAENPPEEVKENPPALISQYAFKKLPRSKQEEYAEKWLRAHGMNRLGKVQAEILTDVIWGGKSRPLHEYESGDKHYYNGGYMKSFYRIFSATNDKPFFKNHTIDFYPGPKGGGYGGYFKLRTLKAKKSTAVPPKGSKSKKKKGKSSGGKKSTPKKKASTKKKAKKAAPKKKKSGGLPPIPHTW